MFIRFGTRQKTLGVHDPYPFQCPSCKTLGIVTFGITCEYFHVWYIPVFPTDKDGIAKCDNCDFKINSLKYNRLTKDLFRELSKKFRYPFYLYTGISIFLLPIVTGLIFLLLDI
jgi:hypothetical protein